MRNLFRDSSLLLGRFLYNDVDNNFGLPIAIVVARPPSFSSRNILRTDMLPIC